MRFDAADIRLTVHPRARRMRLRIDPRDGAVHLVIPRRASRARALAWAESQEDWIAEARGRMAPASPIRRGMTVPLEGASHLLDWSPDRPRRFDIAEGRLLAGGPEDTLPARLLRYLKNRARDVLDEETRSLAAAHDLPLARVSVGDPLSRWGSCATSGAVRYSWRLILAPAFVRRATVAHEVAHLVHMNHGPAFHALAADLFGADPAPAREWLRTNGAALHRFGRA